MLRPPGDPSGRSAPEVREVLLDHGRFFLGRGMELTSSPGLQLNVYSTAPGTPTADGLTPLASWAAMHSELPTEVAATPAS